MLGTQEEYRPGSLESYMNLRQQEYFRNLLLQRRENLQNNCRESLQRIRTNDQHGGDLIDQSVKDRNKIMDFLSRKRQEQMLQQINAALRRIEEGNYGYCLVTGEEIGIQRLLAYPVATLSVEAQEQLESRQRLVSSTPLDG